MDETVGKIGHAPDYKSDPVMAREDREYHEARKSRDKEWNAAIDAVIKELRTKYNLDNRIPLAVNSAVNLSDCITIAEGLKR